MLIEVCSVEILPNSFEVGYGIMWTQFWQFTCIDISQFASAESWSKKFKLLALCIIEETSSPT